MKRQLYLLILITLCSLFEIKAQEQLDSLNVFASTGLKMRETASQTAAVIDTIPYGTKVQILDLNSSSPNLIINGLKGRYFKVKYNDSTGYTFSGYLSKLKPYANWMYWKTLKDYVEDEYKKIGP